MRRRSARRRPRSCGRSTSRTPWRSWRACSGSSGLDPVRNRIIQFGANGATLDPRHRREEPALRHRLHHLARRRQAGRRPAQAQRPRRHHRRPRRRRRRRRPRGAALRGRLHAGRPRRATSTRRRRSPPSRSWSSRRATSCAAPSTRTGRDPRGSAPPDPRGRGWSPSSGLAVAATAPIVGTGVAGRIEAQQSAGGAGRHRRLGPARPGASTASGACVRRTRQIGDRKPDTLNPDPVFASAMASAITCRRCAGRRRPCRERATGCAGPRSRRGGRRS